MSLCAWSYSLLGAGIVGQAYSTAMHIINRLDRQQWFVVLCVALVLGALCLRGFGSRNYY